ncbi:helix-turn-helix domain-containing protein [Ruminococcus sp.]|uniref:helix-turn-helix domain-containing protein n=1 Tax=Ruminococcus sp. TaxID=41978 RepID=UPI003A8DCAB0
MITPTIKAAAQLAGLSRADLAQACGLARPQAISNKYNRDSFTAQDLTRIAQACGVRLAFVDDAGRAVLTFPAPSSADGSSPADDTEGK